MRGGRRDVGPCREARARVGLHNIPYATWLLAAGLALIGASWDARAADPGSTPESASDSLVVQGVTIRLSAELWVDRMPMVAEGCGSAPTRAGSLTLSLSASNDWPDDLEPVRLTGAHGAQARSSAAAWDSRHGSGGRLVLHGIPESWTTIDAMVELLAPQGRRWLVVRGVPQQTAW